MALAGKQMGTVLISNTLLAEIKNELSGMESSLLVSSLYDKKTGQLLFEYTYSRVAMLYLFTIALALIFFYIHLKLLLYYKIDICLGGIF